MSKIKILAIPSDKHGVGKFRMMDPYTFIGNNYQDEVHVDITYNADNNDKYLKIIILYTIMSCLIIFFRYNSGVKLLKYYVFYVII